MKTAILVAFSFVLFACANDDATQVPTDSSTAARAYDRVLTWAEVGAVIPDLSSPEDSAVLAERYINDWLKEQVLLHTAEQRLPDDQKQFEAELEAHRKALLTFAYENIFVQQRLDTLITDEEIQAFYDQNQSIFSLNDYIVKVKFAVLAKDTPKGKLKQFRKLFESEDPEDLVALEQFCVNNGAAYYIDIESWMYFEELLTKVPIDVYNIESFLKSTRSAEFEEGGKSYYLKLLAYELKDAVSPLPLVTNNIKSMILNRRKRDLLVKMRDDLFNDAYARKDVEKLY
jgi:hypothetical protein